MTVYVCRDGAELIREALRIQTTQRGGWLFRGQGDSRWGLVPGLLRTKPGTDEPVISCPELFEEALITNLRLKLQEMTVVPDRFLGEDPATEEDYLLPLAQHYGAITSLLDWTRSPLVACYFAASDALRQKSEFFSVFIVCETTKQVERLKGCKVIVASTAMNDNLFAQRGMFIRHPSHVKNYWAEEHNEVSPKPPESERDPKTKFFRLDLPTWLASDVLHELHKHGLNGAAVFPGMHGYLNWSMNDAWEIVRKRERESTSPKGL